MHVRSWYDHPASPMLRLLMCVDYAHKLDLATIGLLLEHWQYPIATVR